jgi:prohibitin 1
MKKLIVAGLCLIGLGSCVVIRQGEIGAKRKVGKINPEVLNAGAHLFNPFTTKVLRVNVQTRNMDVQESLPSKEGIMVNTYISILYHVDPNKVSSILSTIGSEDYERGILLSVFKSSAPNVSSKYLAKDMYTIGREEIEKGIETHMREVLEARGFMIEKVMLKNIVLPPGLAQSIEQKLEAEQEAQRMEFVLQKERLEADRKKIEAEGIKTAQLIITQGLTPLYLQWKYIEAYKELYKSPNSKIIISDGSTPSMPILLGTEK